MSCCKYGNQPDFKHKYVIVEERQEPRGSGVCFYLCKNCGHEKILDDVRVIEIDHKHNYLVFSGCINSYYIFRCKHSQQCTSFLRIFKKEEDPNPVCSNKRKHHLEKA